MEKQLERLKKYARLVGLRGFILAWKNGPMVSFHFEEVKLDEALTMIITGFHQVIDMNLKRDPPENKAALLKAMGDEFNQLISKYDKAFRALP